MEEQRKELQTVMKKITELKALVEAYENANTGFLFPEDKTIMESSVEEIFGIIKSLPEDLSVQEKGKSDPLMDFIAQEIPWRLKEIHHMELSKEQIEDLVDSVQNNTHVMFDYDQFDAYIHDEVNNILYPVLATCEDGKEVIERLEDEELLASFEKTLEDWEKEKITYDEEVSEFSHLSDELFFSDVIRWYQGDITTEELVKGYQEPEVQKTLKELISDTPEKEKNVHENEMDLEEFLFYFDFNYDIVSPGSTYSYEQKVRQERLEDGDLSPEDMDQDLICLIDLLGGNLGDIDKERYPIVPEVIEKIVERMDVYIQDSVIDEFNEALEARGVDTSNLSLGEMVEKCKELGVDDGEVCYRIAEAVVNPERIFIKELQERDVAKEASEEKSGRESINSKIQNAAKECEKVNRGEKGTGKDLELNDR